VRRIYHGWYIVAIAIVIFTVLVGSITPLKVLAVVRMPQLLLLSGLFLLGALLNVELLAGSRYAILPGGAVILGSVPGRSRLRSMPCLRIDFERHRLVGCGASRCS